MRPRQAARHLRLLLPPLLVLLAAATGYNGLLMQVAAQLMLAPQHQAPWLAQQHPALRARQLPLPPRHPA